MVLALWADAALAAPGSFASDLTELSSEELMDLQETSAGRRPQQLSDVAAAIFVITQDDIRRSGATSIPELLRMVPGCALARINASQWAVTRRGFNGRFANKLLVPVDGRTVYTPLFSSMFWEEQGIPLQNIERIEVIRGPAAALWGANAVNGVVNVITKPARDTQGALVIVAAGTEERTPGALRYRARLANPPSKASMGSAQPTKASS